MGARNFTRALGYAKHPLSVAHAFADARFRRRMLSQTHAFADARFPAFADASFCKCKLLLSLGVGDTKPCLQICGAPISFCSIFI